MLLPNVRISPLASRPRSTVTGVGLDWREETTTDEAIGGGGPVNISLGFRLEYDPGESSLRFAECSGVCLDCEAADGDPCSGILVFSCSCRHGSFDRGQKMTLASARNPAMSTLPSTLIL